MIINLLAVIILLTACDKNSDAVPPLADIDGNAYDTVKIGSQFWMQQNLKTSHYRNGDPIPEITSLLLWSTLTSGAWCWYNNDSVKYASVYGKLYNWYAVNDQRGLAPEGWHVATDPEWSALVFSLGGDLIAGGEMKEKGTKHWFAPNVDATNNSGLTCLPGGYRGDSGYFVYIGDTGAWWSSTGTDATDAFYRNMSYQNGRIYKGDGAITIGYAVRCVRD